LSLHPAPSFVLFDAPTSFGVLYRLTADYLEAAI